MESVLKTAIISATVGGLGQIIANSFCNKQVFELNPYPQTAKYPQYTEIWDIIEGIQAGCNKTNPQEVYKLILDTDGILSIIEGFQNGSIEPRVSDEALITGRFKNIINNLRFIKRNTKKETLRKRLEEYEKTLIDHIELIVTRIRYFVNNY